MTKLVEVRGMDFRTGVRFPSGPLTQTPRLIRGVLCYREVIRTQCPKIQFGQGRTMSSGHRKCADRSGDRFPSGPLTQTPRFIRGVLCYREVIRTRCPKIQFGQGRPMSGGHRKCADRSGAETDSPQVH